MYGHGWPQRQSDYLKLETESSRRNGETLIIGQNGTANIA
jgi:hypothetical protein